MHLHSVSKCILKYVKSFLKCSTWVINVRRHIYIKPCFVKLNKLFQSTLCNMFRIANTVCNFGRKIALWRLKLNQFATCSRIRETFWLLQKPWQSCWDKYNVTMICLFPHIIFFLSYSVVLYTPSDHTMPLCDRGLPSCAGNATQ